MFHRMRTDRGEFNIVKALLLVAVVGIAYVGYARGGIVLQHQSMKAHVRTGANRAYARRNVDVVKEAILKGVKEDKLENEDIAADGSIIRRPLELTDDNMEIVIGESPPNISITLRYERTWIWPFTKKVGRVQYTFSHFEDLSAIKY